MFTRKIHLYCTIYYQSWFISFFMIFYINKLILPYWYIWFSKFIPFTWYIPEWDSFYVRDILIILIHLFSYDIFSSEIHLCCTIYYPLKLIRIVWHVSAHDSFHVRDILIKLIHFLYMMYCGIKIHFHIEIYHSSRFVLR